VKSEGGKGRELSLLDIRFSRPGRTVLRGVSATLGRGAIVAVLGPNGAGKTSLLGVASGRLAPESGSVELEGKSLVAWGRDALARRLALLPQFERLPFNYSCLEFVLMGRAPHLPYLSMPGREDEEAARRALAEMGLAGFESRPAAELSGGEFQLVRMARCLAQEATYLLLDEPTSMLDPANARRIADSLRSLAQGGRGILLATHDVALAFHLADEALLLRSGEVLADGRAAEVLVPERLEEAFGLSFSFERIPTPLYD
jgi:iron complex transport system ATP-binding protein